MEDISNEDKGIYKGENEWQTKGEFWPGSDWNSTDMSTIHFLPAILGASTEGKEWEKAPNSIASIYIKCEICWDCLQFSHYGRSEMQRHSWPFGPQASEHCQGINNFRNSLRGIVSQAILSLVTVIVGGEPRTLTQREEPSPISPPLARPPRFAVFDLVCERAPR